LHAGLRPPLKLHVRFSRMQLSRRFKTSRCQKGMKRDPLGTQEVDPIHQSPRTRAYGFFTKGTGPTSLVLTHLVCFLFLTLFAGCLPRPTSAAGCPVTWLSPRFIGTVQPSDYCQSVARHFACAYRFAYSSAPETLPVLLRSRAVLLYRAARNHLGTVGEMRAPSSS
jgi:hypothetical protein